MEIDKKVNEEITVQRPTCSEVEEARCSSCMNLIEDDEFLCALGQDWHTECFRCSVCDEALNHWYFEKDGLLFCKADYWKNYGEACQQCAQIITGPVMVAGEHKFHPECFTCINCHIYIGDGESYALVERSILFCGACYKKQMESPSRGTVLAKKPHSIQLIELPPTSASQRTIKLSVDSRKSITPSGISKLRGLRIADVRSLQSRLRQLDPAMDLASLHVGDRILEVNGQPVQYHCLQDIEALISESSQSLQLTVEHDPNEISGRRQSFPIANHSYAISQAERHDREGLNGQLFKKKDEGHCSSSQRSRHLRRGQGSKERASSLPKFLETNSSKNCDYFDLSRTHSFRKEGKAPRIFRASDLSQGEFLGRGFFGNVYKVSHLKSGEVMVLKELHRVDEQAQKNFLKEVAVLRSLCHRNVLGFIGVLYKDKRLHLLTEYIGGGTLKELIHEVEGDLPWHQRIGFGRDIAAGMAYLHSMGIIHRDLNSHNCLVREDNTVVVADFGLARILPQQSWATEKKKFGKRHARKKRYTVVGNPYWMAPEMMKGNKYDEKVDLFSFGIILCEVIGRIEADPDYMPRSFDFGLNESVFESKYCQYCPPPFYKIAFLCCNTNPDKRPPFDILEKWLAALALHYRGDTSLPCDILESVYSYSGHSPVSSEPSTPEILTPDSPQSSLFRTIGESIATTSSKESPSQSPLGFLYHEDDSIYMARKGCLPEVAQGDHSIPKVVPTLEQQSVIIPMSNMYTNDLVSQRPNSLTVSPNSPAELFTNGNCASTNSSLNGCRTIVSSLFNGKTEEEQFKAVSTFPERHSSAISPIGKRRSQQVDIPVLGLSSNFLESTHL